VSSALTNTTHCGGSFCFGLSEFGVCAESAPCELHRTDIPCFQPSVPANTNSLVYDLGADFNELEAPDLLVIQNAINFVSLSGSATVTVHGDFNTGFLTGDQQTFNVTTADLVGMTNSDLVLDLNFPTHYRAWRISVTSSIPNTAAWGAVSLGKKFCFSRNPVYPLRFKMLDQYSEAARNTFEAQLFFEGITPAEKSEFDRRVLDFADVVPVFLYDPLDVVLFGKRVFRGYFLKSEIFLKKSSDVYSMRFRVEELL